jgi:hypothetical protein
MPIASVFGSVGLLGMIVARFLGTSAAVNHHKPVLIASVVCLIVAGLIALVHFTINFWFELNRTA